LGKTPGVSKKKGFNKGGRKTKRGRQTGNQTKNLEGAEKSKDMRGAGFKGKEVDGCKRKRRGGAVIDVVEVRKGAEEKEGEKPRPTKTQDATLTERTCPHKTTDRKGPNHPAQRIVRRRWKGDRRGVQDYSPRLVKWQEKTIWIDSRGDPKKTVDASKGVRAEKRKATNQTRQGEKKQQERQFESGVAARS